MVAEVAASSASFDLGTKLNVYRRNGVRGIHGLAGAPIGEIDWFVLRGRRYVPLKIDGEGLYRSRAFPGHWLDPAALIRGKPEIISAALQRRGRWPVPSTPDFVARSRKPDPTLDCLILLFLNLLNHAM